MKVFVSYARLNRDTTNELVADLQSLGHQAFYDQALTGGQRWWDTLLDQIAGADVFVPVLSDEYRDSEACRAEADWAEALHLPFLPVTFGPQSPGMYHPVIAEANWVVYDSNERAALADLARAVGAVQPVPQPDPLPLRPPIPLSYLILVEREIRASDELGRHRQLAIVSELRSKLGGRQDDGARELLAALRQRPDVTYEVALMIDDLLGVHEAQEVHDEGRDTNAVGDDASASEGLPTDNRVTDACETESAHGSVGVAAASSAGDESHDATSFPWTRGQYSKGAVALVLLGTVFIAYSISLAPWITSEWELDEYVWISFMDAVSTRKLYLAPMRYLLAVLGLLLLLLIIAVSMTTVFLGGVPTRVRIAACTLSAVLGIAGIVVTIQHVNEVDGLDFGLGPVILAIGLAMLTYVTARNLGRAA